MLTHRQRQLYDFISGELARTSVPPTCRQMADHLGLVSKSSATRLLDNLEERGMIRRLRNRRQAIEIVDRTNVVPIDVRQRVSVLRFNPITKELEPWQ